MGRGKILWSTWLMILSPEGQALGRDQGHMCTLGIRRNIVYEEWGQCLSHTHRERSHLRLLVMQRTWGRDKEGSCCSYRRGLLRPRQEQQP